MEGLENSVGERRKAATSSTGYNFYDHDETASEMDIGIGN